ncbi:MAG: ABC transporter permease [Anaerolineae bacterium]|jgi:ABC-2 type transport system permease protein|nr:ABC transporter permease [Anaerolineae bacterium]
MAKVWLVAKQEYQRIAGKKSFLISTLGIPILFIGLMVVIVLITVFSEDGRAVGYVDHAGILRPDALEAIGQDTKHYVEIIPYEDETAALTALESGDLQGYYVIPTDYFSAPAVERVTLDSPMSDRGRSDFWDFMHANLVRQLPEAEAQRLYEGANLSLRTVDGKRQANDADFISALFPIVAAVLFFISVMSIGGYMLQAVADEKENRTMEVLMTSLSPEQLMGGKALGLLGVVLTQIGLWGLTLAIGLVVAPLFIADFPKITVPWSMVVVGVLYFLPSLALISGMMIAIGATVSEVRQGQQISGILNLAFTFPMFFLMVILGNPNHPFTVGLSLFPTTSFITMLLRWGFTTIPTWQLIVSWTLLVGSAWISIRFAAQVFRLGMLHYGQPLTLKGILVALRQSHQGV